MENTEHLDEQTRNALEQNIPVVLSQVALLTRVLFNRDVKQHELTSTQWLILRQLDIEGGRTQTEIAALLTRSKSSVGKSLDSLERRGWIERVADEKDRRVNKIYLTDKIDETKGDLVTPLTRLNNTIENGISSDELVAFKKTLSKILANLEFANE